MKNNKGYTLVELLVTLAVFAVIMSEVGSMLMNSSRLYRNGTYEVELQTEAQQIVQQMEELLIDVNNSVSTNYQVSLSSDFITISNNTMGLEGTGDSTVYYFTVDKDPDRGYGNLYFSKTSSADPDSNVSNVLMGEYVQSISLDMAAYDYDVVTLNVSMNNGRYGYQASQDIYLRNGVGSGGGGSYNNSAEYDVELDVLRYKEYNLNDVVAGLGGKPGETFTYAWDAPDQVDADTYYVISTNDKLSLKPSWNQKINWSKEMGPYKLIATGNMGSVFNIKVGTVKVGYGNDNHAVYYQNVASSYRTMTPVPVYGIDVSKANNMKVWIVYDNGDELKEDLIWANGSPYVNDVIESGEHMIGNYTATYNFPSEGAGSRIEMSFQKLKFDSNGNDNTIEVMSYYMQDNQIINHNANGLVGYYEYIRCSRETVRFKVALSYGSDVEEIYIHMLPAPVWTEWDHKYPSMDDDSVPDVVAQYFWEAVGF